MLRSDHGLTVVEMLLALALGAVVLVGVIQIMVSGTRQYEQAEAKLHPREKAIRALVILRSLIQDTTEFLLENAGQKIVTIGPRGRTTIRWEAPDLIQERNGTTRKLVAGEVDRFHALAPHFGLLEVEIGVAGSTAGDEIYLPAIARRRFDVPFKRDLLFAPLAPGN